MTGHDVVQFAKNNELVLGLLVTAAVSTMPAPDCSFSLKTFYTWIYDGAHLFVNMRRPTPPAATPANPKQ